MNKFVSQQAMQIDWLNASLDSFLTQVEKHQKSMSCIQSLPQIINWKSVMSFVPAIPAINTMNIFSDKHDLLDFCSRYMPFEMSNDYNDCSTRFQMKGNKESEQDCMNNCAHSVIFHISYTCALESVLGVAW